MNALEEHFLNPVISSQGGVRVGPSAEGADPDGRAAAGSPLGREELAEQRPPGILAKPQNNIVRRGQGESVENDLLLFFTK